MSGKLIDTAELRVSSPKAPLPQLDHALAKLNAMQSAITSLNQQLSALSQPVLFKKTAADVREMIREAERLGRFGQSRGGSFKPASLKPEELARALGVDAAAFERFVTQSMLGGTSKAQKEVRRKMREMYSAATGEFRNEGKAAQAMSLFTKQFSVRDNLTTSMGSLLTPAAPHPGPLPRGEGGAIAAASGAGGGGGRGRGGKNVEFETKRLKVLEDLEKQRGDTNLDAKKMSGAYRRAADQLQALGGEYEHTGNRQAKLDLELARLRRQGQQKEDAARGEEIKNLGTRRRGQGGAEASAQREAERQSAAAAADEAREKKELAASRRSQNKYLKDRTRAEEKLAKDAERAASADAGSAMAKMGHRRALQMLDDLKRGGFDISETGRQSVGTGGTKARQTYTARQTAGGRTTTHQIQLNFQNGNAAGATVSTGSVVTPPPIPRPAPAAGRGLIGTFLANTGKVALWSASVGVLYKSMQLLEFSISSVIRTGAQMARLDQVFSKIGGTTRQLTDDVLALAAANGRGAEEAMNSAIAWSRLGMTRKQVTDLVRVDLMAANVAEVDSATATKNNMAIMQAYGLSAADMASELAELNAISNIYNVTVGQMYDGIARTAAVAKQAGLPLAELKGLIGATVGATGQTGSNIGNAIKSLTVSLGNPALQTMLRERFRIEATTNGGEDLKNESQLLGELYDRYQQLNTAQRQALIYHMAGKTQASRVTALIENYVKGQELAVKAQLMLNSAEQENAKIKNTLKAQLTGLVTEWERFVVLLNDGSANEGLGEILGTFHRINGAILRMQEWTKPERSLLERTLAGRPARGRGIEGSNATPDGSGGGGDESEAQSDAQRFGRAANSARMAARLLKTVRDTLPYKEGKAREGLLNSVAEVSFPDELGKEQRPQTTAMREQLRILNEAGDVAGMQRVLEQQRLRLLERGVNLREKERISLEQLNDELDYQLKKMQSAQQQSYSPERQKQIDKLQKDKSGLSDRYLGMVEEELGTPEDFERGQANFNAALERTKGLLEQIGRLYQDIPGVDNVGRVTAETQALQAQLVALQERKALLEASNDFSVRREKELLDVRKQMADAQARMAGAVGGLGVARAQDRLGFGQAAARREFVFDDVGRSETDRLMNRRGGAQRVLGEFNRDPSNDPLEIGRALEAQNELYRSGLGLLERHAQLHREIRQLAIDENKEFQKSLLGAGPGELLRKMAAQRMAGGGRLTGGQFMALSPAMRGDVGMLDLRFNPRGMDLRAELDKNKKNQPLGNQWENQFNALRAIGAGVDELRARFNDIAAMNEGAAALKQMADAAAGAMRAMENLGVLGDLPALMAQAMEAVGLAAEMNAPGPALPQGGGLNAGRAPGR